VFLADPDVAQFADQGPIVMGLEQLRISQTSSNGDEDPALRPISASLAANCAGVNSVATI
jgi:hypothetical protein